MVGIARHLGDLVGGELGDRHLVGIDAGFGQDHPQQGDVGLGPADDADAMSGEIAELLDLRRRRFFRAFGRKAGNRPQHHDVLAQDGDRLGVGRQIQVAARDREVGLLGRQQRDALDRAVGCDRVQPHRAAVAGKGLRQRLHQFLVVAAGRADRDAQGDRAAGCNTARPRRRRTGRCRRPAPAANSLSACGVRAARPRVLLRSDDDIVLPRYTKNLNPARKTEIGPDLFQFGRSGPKRSCRHKQLARSVQIEQKPAGATGGPLESDLGD